MLQKLLYNLLNCHTESTGHCHSLTLKIAYWFDEKGLRMRIIDYSIDLHAGPDEQSRPDFGKHPTFGEFIDESAVKEFEKYLESATEKIDTGMYAEDIRRWLLTRENLKVHKIEAIQTLEAHCLPCLREIIEKHHYHDQRVEILDWQFKVNNAFQDILTLYEIIAKQKSMEIHMCLPEISSNGNILSTNRMYPIRLYSKKARNLISPFGEFSVNGQIVNLTGPNGSGKSTALITAFDNQILFQAGLFIFAKQAEMSVKDKIFLSFLERQTDESTFRAKMLKDKKIVCKIKEMNDVQRQKAIIFIDELGSATTEGSVLPIVEEFVDWLAKQGVSVVMSTQIPKLSQYIGEKFGGINYIIDGEYNFVPGIGEGEPIKIAEDIGFLEALRN